MGGLSIFAPQGDESLLLAQARMRDHAVDEIVEIAAVPAPSRRFARSMAGDRHEIRLTNAGQDAMTVEIELFDDDDARLTSPSQRLSRRDGLWLWTSTVPANGTAQLAYTLRPRRQ